jgi:hypothetical protein
MYKGFGAIQQPQYRHVGHAAIQCQFYIILPPGMPKGNTPAGKPSPADTVEQYKFIE